MAKNGIDHAEMAVGRCVTKDTGFCTSAASEDALYTTERAHLIAEQLRKFTSGYAHHVAGHFANMDFWLDEAEGALRAIDGHSERFDALKAGQAAWVERHATEVPVGEFCARCGGECEFSDGSTVRPPAPWNRATSEKRDARRELVDAAYYFLARCCRMRLLSERDMRTQCDRLGTSIDPEDIRRS